MQFLSTHVGLVVGDVCKKRTCVVFEIAHSIKCISYKQTPLWKANEILSTETTFNLTLSLTNYEKKNHSVYWYT